MIDWLAFWVRFFCLPDLGKQMATPIQRYICVMILPSALEDMWHVKADNDNSDG